MQTFRRKQKQLEATLLTKLYDFILERLLVPEKIKVQLELSENTQEIVSLVAALLFQVSEYEFKYRKFLIIFDFFQACNAWQTMEWKQEINAFWRNRAESLISEKDDAVQMEETV